MLVLNHFVHLSAFAFVVAILAVAYYRFTQPGEVLAWWAYWINTAYQKAVIRHQQPTNDDHERYLRYEWLLKPILTCEKCIAGQMALWLFLVHFPFDALSILYVIGLASYLATSLLNKLN